jgi:ureidoglycolate lyase
LADAVTRVVIKAAPLTAEAFAPFGDVIEISGRHARWINDHTSERFDDLAEIDVLGAGGRPLVSIFKATPRSLPLHVRALERHPLSSQAFMPLDCQPFLVIVAEGEVVPEGSHVHAYLSSGLQGVNYRRNTWHHPLIALEDTSHFLVIDRGGPGENCETANVTQLAAWVDVK